jgi:hypothetical protein
MVKIPVFNKSEVFDVTGAGDTVTAVFTMALAGGADPEYAAIIGNIAASIVVRQFGCSTTTVEEILNNLEKNINAPNSSQALYDYNTLYEFAAFLLTEVRLNQYTRRERQWLTHLNQITGYALDHAVITPERLDPKRFELLRAHLSQFIQDTQQRALELDQQPVSSGLYFTEPDVSFIREQREQVVERRIVMR